ncbi:cysteine desulfurase [Labrys sp. KNU-23]|uniref:cysteine desulfurase family protein n=1 Tax=Labrys sp. KNU-23 TaxID=2789216 RepID=UPI0011F06D04|nr:cysteine desulfurase family protein [Labrys sp. KNU-23]QEN90892.1 cysteine desulfurase [Labrys sp. KNU-23]
MTRSRTYLDHNATAPLRQEARAALLAALDLCGAPSSVHADGRAVRKLVEAARHEVADLVDALAKNVVFCASATEANNLALNLDWQRPGKPSLRRMAVSSVEHASVTNGAHPQNTDIALLPVDGQGVLDLGALDALLNEWRENGETGLVSVMLANNETGVVQPVGEIAARVHANGGLFHCDAAQAVGKIPCSINEIDADLLTISSHKLGGPLGAGALVLGSDSLHQPNALIRGGGQEKGLRAGTENVPALAGFGVAARAAARDLATYAEKSLALRSMLEAALRETSPDMVLFGEGATRLPNTLNFAEPGMAAETTLIALDLEGISVSSGSACSSGKVKVSHVLTAMGVAPALAGCALRVSLGRETTVQEIEFFVTAWKRLRKNLHERRHRAA